MKILLKTILLFILIAPLHPFSLFSVDASTVPSSETLISPFDYSSTARTSNVYSGLVEIAVSGVGQGTGTQWNDAFWLYTDEFGNNISPYQYNNEVPLRISFTNDSPWDQNGEPIQNYIVMINGQQVPKGTIPTYNPEHIYNFVLDIGLANRTLYFGNVDSGLWDNTGEYYITIKQRMYVIIYQILAGSNRCGVGETQSIRVHAKWFNGSDVSDGLVYIGNEGYETNPSGWISFDEVSSTAAKKTWKVTAVNCTDVTDFIQPVAFSSVIWDRINVTLSVSDDRIDVGSKVDVRWTAFYEYDGSPYQGKVNIKIINSQTSPPIAVGKASYVVESVEDSKYGLTVFVSNQVDCIWDRVKITEGGVTNSFASTGSIESVWFKAVYEYDGEEFNGDKGKIFVNNIPLIWSTFDRAWKFSTKLDDKGKLTFEVSGIEDMQYKLTTFIDAVGPQSITWEKPFLETPAGIASIAAVLAVVAAWTTFFLRKKK